MLLLLLLFVNAKVLLEGICKGDSLMEKYCILVPSHGIPSTRIIQKVSEFLASSSSTPILPILLLLLLLLLLSESWNSTQGSTRLFHPLVVEVVDVEVVLDDLALLVDSSLIMTRTISLLNRPNKVGVVAMLGAWSLSLTNNS